MKFRKIDVNDNNIFVLVKENLDNSTSLIVMFEIYQNDTLVEKVFSTEVFLSEKFTKKAIDRIIGDQEKINEIISDNQSIWLWKFNLSSFFYKIIKELSLGEYQSENLTEELTWIQHIINRIVTKMEIELSK